MLSVSEEKDSIGDVRLMVECLVPFLMLPWKLNGMKTVGSMLLVKGFKCNHLKHAPSLLRYCSSALHSSRGNTYPSSAGVIAEASGIPNA